MLRARQVSPELIQVDGLTKEQIANVLNHRITPYVLNYYAFGDQVLIEFDTNVALELMVDVVSRSILSSPWNVDENKSNSANVLNNHEANNRRQEHSIRFQLDGEDLNDAIVQGITIDALTRALEETEYQVEEIAFAPGFLYLSGLPDSCHLPRRATPRPLVPPRSLALGGPYVGIYSLASPGGWNIVGTIIDPIEELVIGGTIKRGDKIRFIRQDRSDDKDNNGVSLSAFKSDATRGNTYETTEAAQVEGIQLASRSGTEHLHGLKTLAEITEITGQVTVQGGFRDHLGPVAISRSGPVDAALLQIANLAVGNSAELAGIEIALGSSIEFRVLVDSHIAYTRESIGVFVEGHQLSPMCVVPVNVGESVRVSNPFGGDRSYEYLAFGGGISSQEANLGEVQSFDTLSTIGQRIGKTTVLYRKPREGPLRSNIVFNRTIGETAYSTQLSEVTDFTNSFSASKVKVEPELIQLTLGPDDELFTSKDIARLSSTTFSVTGRKSRSGVHLEITPKIQFSRALAKSHPIAAGALQINPDGNGFVIGRDHPVSGGYPVIGYFSKSDLVTIMQLPPDSSFSVKATLPTDLSSAITTRPATTSTGPDARVINEDIMNLAPPTTNSNRTLDLAPEDIANSSKPRATARFAYHVVGYLPLEEQVKH